MTKRLQWLMPCLAIAHFVWGLFFILVAAYAIFTALAVLAYTSTGNIWSRLLAAMFIALQYSSPFLLLGGWILILGRRIRNGTRPVRKVLLVTHGILLVIGSLSVIIGVYAVREAEISIARGGGLLSPVAWVPLIFGIILVILALPSIILAGTAVANSTDSRKTMER